MSAIRIGELLRTFTRIGILSFGGPAGQIAVMHRILVEEKRWIGEQRFMHALNYCMLLPGPEAQQLCTYCGWLLGGTWGGILAGALFVIPGFFCLLALSIAYVWWGDTQWLDALFYGLKPAVIALVIAALLRVGKKALKSRAQIVLAICSFLALTVFHAPYPAVVAGAIIVGFMTARRWPHWFTISHHATAANDHVPIINDELLHHAPATLRHAVGVGVVWASVWLLPLGVIAWWCRPAHIFSKLGMFFSHVAMVTFGGAYAVLPYVGQHAVSNGWISPTEMVDGLGLAETTPGPLILVLQFVGFLSAFHQPGSLHPLIAGISASVITIWATFMPSYLWIFTGAPWVERLRHHARLSAALSAITAGVVGVIASLAVWFAIHVCFTTVNDRHWHGLHWWATEMHTIDLVAVAIASAASIALIRIRLSLAWVLGGSVALGAIWKLLIN